MQKMKKIRVIAIMSAIVLGVNGIPGCHSASNTDKSEASEIYSLDSYLEDESKEHNTDLKADLEAELNEQGIFDDEIKDIDETVINNIEDGADYKVVVEYYTECTENDSETSKGSLKELTEAEVDKVINKHYNPKTTDENITVTTKSGKKVIFNPQNGKQVDKKTTSTEVNSNKFASFLENTGLVAKTISAKTDEGYSESGMVKRTLVVTKVSKYKVKVSVTYKWVDTPKNTLIDAFGIYLKNATPVVSTISASYSAASWTNTGTGVSSGSYSKKLSCEYNGNGVAAKVNLLNTGTYVGYYNHTLKMSYTATIDEYDSWKYMVAWSEYFHQKKTIQVDPVISLGVDGSIAFSASVQKYMTTLTNSPQITYYYR